MSERAPHKGSLSINKYSMQKVVSIHVEDETSGTRCIEIRMGLNEFAEALMGLSNQDCEFGLFPALVGKKYEHKVLEVTMPTQGVFGQDEVTEVAMRACKPYEVDGWEADYRDATNHHRWMRNEGKRNQVYKIGFTRFVDIQETA